MKKKMRNLVASKPENNNLTPKTTKRKNFNSLDKRGRRSILSLLTLSYKLTKLREK